MEAGFTGIDDQSLEVSKNERIYLLRIPKEFNVTLLNGVEIDLSKDTMSSVKSNGVQYHIQKDTSGAFQRRVRPVILDRLTSNGGISRGFDDVINITADLSVPAIDHSSITQTSTYPKKPQLDFLAVRSMPRGSTSTLSELKKRQLETAASLKDITSGDKKSKKHKKDKKDKESSSSAPQPVIAAAAPVVSLVPEVVDIESEEKKKKKKKKDKSHKD